MFKKRKRLGILLTVALAASALTSPARPLDKNTSSHKKLVIIGMDGFDPTLADAYMAEGRLPNFKALKEKGTYSRLKTSMPPQSPVAWSCFISGQNPGQHDVFDFVVRDPSTYLPEIGMTETKKNTSGLMDSLLSGLTGPNVVTRRKGKSFWDYLGDHKIPSVILRCPVTFPADPLDGKLISGMGTPDIRGTQGIHSFYTTGQIDDKDVHGKIFPVAWDKNIIKTNIMGPKVRKLTKSEDVLVPLTLEKIANGKIRLMAQDADITLAAGGWSRWIRIKFDLGYMKSVYGICRFHLNAVEPHLSLYMTPVNIDPTAPAMVISYPTNYAKEIFEKIGTYYYTQGIPYDTWALNEGRLSEEKFIEQAYSILDEHWKTFQMELSRLNEGLLFFYIGTTDPIQHMFYRYLDKTHPSKGTSKNPTVVNAIPNIYKRMDDILGEVLPKLDKDTTLLILSDHGFASFRRSVHINSWLRDNGFLALHENASEGLDFFANVDWARTQAYSLGFGGIYINQFKREKNGIVYPGKETDELKKLISAALLKWHDGDGSPVVQHVYNKEELYKGPYADNGPDLYIGFHKNFRASWQTGLGAAPLATIEDNTRVWSGDHLCDPTFVPGILVSNRPLNVNHDSGLMDLAPTILDIFGIEKPESLEGHSLLKK